MNGALAKWIRQAKNSTRNYYEVGSRPARVWYDVPKRMGKKKIPQDGDISMIQKKVPEQKHRV